MSKLIFEYQDEPKNLVLMGRYSNPPNPSGAKPNPNKRFVREHRNYSILSGAIKII